MRLKRSLSVAAGVAVMAAACGDVSQEAERPPLVRFDTVDAAVISDGDTTRITAELADTGVRRSYGLMERSTLPADHGMLFVYPETQPETGSFWMYRTEIPLDIAFLDADGEIVSIRAMDPCTSPNPEFCRSYPSDAPYRGALEVRQGFFERHGVEVGDRVVPAPGLLPSEP